ncbi:hypothetical protein H1C71_041399, partial [Ictidomys tridecemlineatus]
EITGALKKKNCLTSCKSFEKKIYERLLLKKTKTKTNKNPNQNKSKKKKKKKQTLACITTETSGLVKQLLRQHNQMSLLYFYDFKKYGIINNTLLLVKSHLSYQGKT